MSEFIEKLNSISDLIRDTEAEFIVKGYSAINILGDPLEWKLYGKKHRILFMGKPLIEHPFEKRLQGSKFIPNLKKELDFQADALIEQIQGALK